jgi:Alpha amylase, catalytic domain
MRKLLLVNPRALLAIVCLAIKALAPLYAAVPPGPKWLETAVFYQVYPQSFFDSNGDGIGDLPGITAKLDYIQSVGCNAIWINPIYESPFGDAGYDVADFYKVAPRYGTNEDLKNLCIEAHKRGIHVCLDLVAGHTSVAHHGFNNLLSISPTVTRIGTSGRRRARVFRTPSHFPASRIVWTGTCLTSFLFNRP